MPPKNGQCYAYDVSKALSRAAIVKPKRQTQINGTDLVFIKLRETASFSCKLPAATCMERSLGLTSAAPLSRP